jgi:hypothetical protein
VGVVPLVMERHLLGVELVEVILYFHLLLQPVAVAAVHTATLTEPL